MYLRIIHPARSCLVFAFALFAGAAHAQQSYPSRPVRMLVGR